MTVIRGYKNNNKKKYMILFRQQNTKIVWLNFYPFMISERWRVPKTQNSLKKGPGEASQTLRLLDQLGPEGRVGEN